jgi:hypothetical protein
VGKAGERDELARSGESTHTLLRVADGRGRICGAANGEVRQRDAVEALLVAPERGVDVDAEVRDVTHGSFEPRVLDDPCRRQAERRRELRARQQQERFPAEARAEAADVRGVYVVAPIGVVQDGVDRRRQRQRTHRLQCDEVAIVKQRIYQIIEAGEIEVGETQIAVEHADRHVAVGRDLRERLDVVPGNGAASKAVRIKDRGPLRVVENERRLAAALHVRDHVARRQHVMGRGFAGSVG